MTSADPATRATPAPVLVLLHGLGANADVWRDLQRLALADGRFRDVVAIDLPGHANGPELPAYDVPSQARVVAEQLATLAEPPYAVLGHSLGGALAVALADPRYRLELSQVVAAGVKASWSADELAKAADIASRPRSILATREQAVQRYLAVSGLRGLVDGDHPTVARGVLAQGDGWTIALDPGAVGVGDPELARLAAAAACPVLLARGEHDQMSTAEALTAVARQAGIPLPRTLPGLGHNLHVEDPAAVLALIG